MAFRQIISKAIFPTLERDLSRSVGKEVGAMDEFLFLSPSVYSFQAKKSLGGAFGRTASPEAPSTEFVRVEKPVVTRGLFHE
eukprot:CAMPEP_0197832614 /NCGR_PEP_ID=MMETSP1437-20131217/15307_1 /TAXON_ID=49252 ORGANISM="Eucampia antarctica, Strain CCMP1452" /NCGR_SAMPLE_ID=MMETSP1437 /ASSEMBLY_ACC=CAM_ASM_001096 /LENGTH=81 /DNA_ID=CAMNT_0043436067 /DNA_START=80 /DNA_END=325 /DNA_ORIENTATION=+